MHVVIDEGADFFFARLKLQKNCMAAPLHGFLWRCTVVTEHTHISAKNNIKLLAKKSLLKINIVLIE